MNSLIKNSVLLKQFSETQEAWTDNYMKFRQLHEIQIPLRCINEMRSSTKKTIKRTTENESWKIKHCIEEYNTVFQQQTQASRRKNQWTKR